MRLNMSIDTDPQQQEAASPRVLVVRSFLRYAARRRVWVLAAGGVGCVEHCASFVRFVVARTSQSFASAVNRRRFGAVLDRASAVAPCPVVTLGQAAGNAAGLARRQLPRPSRLPPGFFSVCSSQARCVARAVASIGPLVPVSLHP
jgi:hypothetical protein